MRKKIVAGNWKMNKSITEATELMVALADFQGEFPDGVEVVVAPPALYLAGFELMDNPSIQLAAQNCSDKDSGAWTGEISAAMLHDMRIPYCLVGHSERRQFFYENNEVIKNKIDACLRHSVAPIFCCGEMLEEREKAIHFDTVGQQIQSALWHLNADQMSKVVIAYEPVWAIGTGVTASTGQAQEMHAFIRSTLAQHFGNEVASSTPILYGGSVNALNSEELFAQVDVDGGLVGGASLKAKDFLTIIKSMH